MSPTQHIIYTNSDSVGPAGKLIGSSGGDIGNELTLGITILTFIPLRYIEKKVIGR